MMLSTCLVVVLGMLDADAPPFYPSWMRELFDQPVRRVYTGAIPPTPATYTDQQVSARCHYSAHQTGTRLARSNTYTHTSSENIYLLFYLQWPVGHLSIACEHKQYGNGDDIIAYCQRCA